MDFGLVCYLAILLGNVFRLTGSVVKGMLDGVSRYFVHSLATSHKVVFICHVMGPTMHLFRLDFLTIAFVFVRKVFLY